MPKIKEVKLDGTVEDALQLHHPKRSEAEREQQRERTRKTLEVIERCPQGVEASRMLRYISDYSPYLESEDLEKYFLRLITLSPVLKEMKDMIEAKVEVPYR